MSNSKRVLRQRYELFGTVGVGNFGKVFEAFDRHLQVKCAIKELFPEVTQNPEMMKITQMEVDILKKIDHRYIIKLFDNFAENGTYYLVYEFCEKGDLKYNIDKKRISEQDALKIVYQMAEALCELKKHEIIHRDIKPENLFLTNDICKLGDFGLCFKGDRVQLSSSVGSLGFLAPETQLQLIYSPKADVYSLGICFYEMIHGDIPFSQNQIADLVQVKLNLKIERKPGITASDETLDLIRRMVDPDEQRRISCTEVRAMLAPRFPQYQLGKDYESKGIHQIRRVSGASVPGTTQTWSMPQYPQMGIETKPANITEFAQPQRIQGLPPRNSTLPLNSPRPSEKGSVVAQQMPMKFQPIFERGQTNSKVAYKSYSALPQGNPFAYSEPNKITFPNPTNQPQPQPEHKGTSEQSVGAAAPQKHQVPSRMERSSIEMPVLFKQHDFIQHNQQRSQLPQERMLAERSTVETADRPSLTPGNPSHIPQVETTNRNYLNYSQQLAAVQTGNQASQPSNNVQGKQGSYLMNPGDWNQNTGGNFSYKESNQLQNQAIFSEYGHQVGFNRNQRTGFSPLHHQPSILPNPGLANKRPHFSSMSSLFPNQNQVSAAPNFVPNFHQLPAAPSQFRPGNQAETAFPINPAHLPQNRPSLVPGNFQDSYSRPPSPRKTTNPLTGLHIVSQPAQYGENKYAQEIPVPAQEKRFSTSDQQNRQVGRSVSVARRETADPLNQSMQMQPRALANPRFIQNTPMLDSNGHVEVKSNGNFYLQSPPTAPQPEPTPRMMPKSFQAGFAPNTTQFSYGAPSLQISTTPAGPGHQQQMSNSLVLDQDSFSGALQAQMSTPTGGFHRPNPLERVMLTEPRNSQNYRGNQRSPSIETSFYGRFQGAVRGPPPAGEEVSVVATRTPQEAISASKGLRFEEQKRNLTQPQLFDKILSREALHEMLQPRGTAPESGSGPSVRPFEISFRNGYKMEEAPSRATVGGTGASGPRQSVNPLLARVSPHSLQIGRDNSQPPQRANEPFLAFNQGQAQPMVNSSSVYGITNKHF